MADTDSPARDEAVGETPVEAAAPSDANDEPTTADPQPADSTGEADETDGHAADASAEAEPAGEDQSAATVAETDAAVTDEPAAEEEKPAAIADEPTEPAKATDDDAPEADAGAGAGADEPASSEARTVAEPASDQSSPPAASGNPANMTREQFIQSMGLTDDDVRNPALNQDDTLPTRADLDGDGIDDDFIRHADLSEQLIAKAAGSPDADSEYRVAELQKYRTKTSTNTTASDESPRRSDAASHNDQSAAQEYRLRMLEEFRNRKACGLNKTPARSPRKAAAEPSS